MKTKIFLHLVLLLGAVSALHATKTFSFYSSDRGRTYTVESTAAGTLLTFPGHWMYEPSLILPAPETGNMYTLLFNSNRIANQDTTGGTAVFMSQSSSATTGYTTPTIILSNTWVSNICDMAAVRAVYDGSLWHVYVQAIEGNYVLPCPPTGATLHNAIYKATGPTLTSLNWVTDPGTSNAKKILYTSLPGHGLGQDFSIFYSGPNGGDPSQPIQATYNDWGYSVSPAEVFSYLSPNGTSPFYYWYNVAPSYGPPGGGFTGSAAFPDVILKGSLDEVSKGNPSFTAHYSCYDTGSLRNLYQYSRGVGLYPDPVPYGRVPKNGVYFSGELESTGSDANGQRMFTPNFSRNTQGYLTPNTLLSTPSKKVWTGYVVYNPNQINRTTSDACDRYFNWNSSGQGFAISSVKIEEQ